jgi:hypothetical protein
MNYSLEDRTDPRFKHLLGKKVRFTCEGVSHTGTLDFAGINDFLHNKFQVTISRTPFWPVDPESLKEV